MSTIKVDTIRNYDSAVDFSQGFKLGGADVIQNYTESADMPETPTPVNGDYWWDTANEVLYRYMDGGFRALGVTLPVTIDWGGARGFFLGGYRWGGNAENSIDYFDITSTTNAQDFGDLTVAGYNLASVGSNSRVCAGGGTGSRANVIDYITTANTGNATDFGDLTVGVYGLSGAGNGTRGLFMAGYGSSAYQNVISYITIANTGNAQDFGDLSGGKRYGAALGNATRAVYAGGYQASINDRLNTMEYVTIGSTGNVTDFGDLHGKLQSPAGCSDETRGVFVGGWNANTSALSNTMEYITIGTTGNATDFGDLSQANTELAATSDGVTGIVAGGYNNTIYLNDIQKFTIQTLGNASVGMQLTTGGTGGKALGTASSGNAS